MTDHMFQTTKPDVMQFSELTDIRHFLEENESDSEDVDGRGKKSYRFFM